MIQVLTRMVHFNYDLIEIQFHIYEIKFDLKKRDKSFCIDSQI